MEAIVYCRVSRSSGNTMSLDSQEHAIRNFLAKNHIDIYQIIRSVGSAYNKPQDDLVSALNSSRNKLLVVYEPNRLTRNLNTFEEIQKICNRNHHGIAVVTEEDNTDVNVYRRSLYDSIVRAYEESVELGRRVARTMKYKRDYTPAWGKSRNDYGDIVNNENEIKITRLINALSTEGESVSYIGDLLYEVGDPFLLRNEPFEIVEYTRGSKDDRPVSVLPNAMSPTQIANTLNLYGIRKRRAKWSSKDVKDLLSEPSRKKVKREIDLDSLCQDFEVVRTDALVPVESVVEWICIWYDPAYGLPPNVVLPENMTLPSVPTQLYLPVKKQS